MQPYYTQATLHELPSKAKLAVIGKPIGHSKSPQMQQAALDAAGLEHCYIRAEAGLEEGDFETLVRELQQRGFIGVNVTVPFKRKAYAMANKHDALSAAVHASNTLIFEKNGSISAQNTDGPGFEQAIFELLGKKLSELRIVILGACGGAGSALAAQCSLAKCAHLTLVNRPRPELAQLQTQLAANSALHFDSPELESALKAAQLIVNASSLGLKEGDPLPFPAQWLSPSQAIYDIVTHETPLYRAAAACGCTHISTGESMLLWQGAFAFKAWFPQHQANTDLMRSALAEASKPKARLRANSKPF